MAVWSKALPLTASVISHHYPGSNSVPDIWQRCQWLGIRRCISPVSSINYNYKMSEKFTKTKIPNSFMVNVKLISHISKTSALFALPLRTFFNFWNIFVYCLIDLIKPLRILTRSSLMPENTLFLPMNSQLLASWANIWNRWAILQAIAICKKAELFQNGFKILHSH